MSSLHIDSVTKSYSGKVILSDIFLTCEVGEIAGLLGRNGSGKSTLMEIVFGTVQADTKFIRIGEKIIRNNSDGRKLINYLPQHNFLPNIKIKTIINLFLPEKNSDILFQNDFLKPLLQKTNFELSSGQKRIIEILLLIHSNAEFILLDEPFNGLSPVAKEYIVNSIIEMKSQKGFIITDHDYENVLNLADKFYYLKNGFLKGIKDKNELVDLGYMTQYNYRSVYKNKS